MMKTGILKNERAIGYNISSIMKEKNITIEQLSEETQISEIHIQAIITGSVGIEDEELEQIAEGLEVTSHRLLHPVPDETLQNYNIHYMGKANSAKDMNEILDEVDLYVRLLNNRSRS